jgi:P27 family predicted phage terminase small subunit
MPGTWRSGGKPKPTALKLLQGSEVRGRKHEPKPEPGRPAAPARLAADELATAAWESLAQRLETLGVLTTANGEALALLAEALADYDRCRAQLAQMNYQQLVVDEMRDKAGTVIRRRVRENPLLRRTERIALLVNRLLGEFGLTPATAARIDARLVPERRDPFEAFLGSRRPR